MLPQIFHYLHLRLDPKYITAGSTLTEIAISLKYHNVATMVISVPDISTTSLLFPAIVQSKDQHFYMLEAKDDTQLFLFDIQKNKKIKLTTEDYKKSFRPEILLLERTESISINKKGYLSYIFAAQSAKYKYYIFSICLAISFLLLLSVPNLTWMMSGLLLLSIAGICLAVGYFMQEKGFGNIAFDMVCAADSGQSACTEKPSVSIVGFTFAELGTAYFLYSIFALVCVELGFDELSISVVYFISVICSLVMVLVSIYQQWFKNKSVCRLCMCINIILILQAILIFTQFKMLDTDISNNIILLSIGFISLGFVALISSHLGLVYLQKQSTIRENQIWPHKVVIERFLTNSLLIISETTDGVRLGNQAGRVQFILIIHLSCRHCLDAFRQLCQLLMMNPDTGLTIYVRYEDSKVHRQSMASLIHACLSNDIPLAFHTFHTWKHGVAIDHIDFLDDDMISTIIHQNDQFFKDNVLTSYPTILIDGRLVPSFIDFAHIKVAYS